MNQKQPALPLTDYTVNVKMKLALLWSSLMLLYIYADYFRLMLPGKIQEMMDLKTPVGETTPRLLIIFSLLLIVPALMIALSVLLKPVFNKWLNIIFGLLYAVISILIIVAAYSDAWQGFFVVYNVTELIVLTAIVWQAWKWPQCQPAEKTL